MALKPNLSGSVVPASMNRTTTIGTDTREAVTAPVQLGTYQFGSYTTDDARARMRGDPRMPSCLQPPAAPRRGR